MTALIFLLYLAVAVAIAIPLLRWIGGPMDSLARLHRRRVQLTVADLLVLFATLQGVVGTVHFFLSRTAAESSTEQARYDAASFLIADSIVAVFLLLCW